MFDLMSKKCARRKKVIKSFDSYQIEKPLRCNYLQRAVNRQPSYRAKDLLSR